MTLTFVETPLFTRQLAECVEDGDYLALQQERLTDPERGDLLVGCHGLRKTRMALGGRGKSGGARVIYLYLPENHLLYFFLLFKKSDTANLSASQRNHLGIIAEQIKATYAENRKNP
ncbi:MAG: type II toxin-antitoxin system RelE/ParE family toxin [Verrucomicrobia bacterium]|nr:type II toxin-antitoxin system RelE/ParE family toxin [Verrucomicrobiota bacterium]